jgi:hypothetical protein
VIAYICFVFPHLSHYCIREQREDKVSRALLKLCYGLKERFLDASAEEVKLIADIVSVAQLVMMLPTGDLLDPEGDQWLSRR